jgi:hypothetical protein
MDKAEIVFEKIAMIGPIAFGRKAGRKLLNYLKKKQPDTLKPIGPKNTPVQQTMVEHATNKKTWMGGTRPVSPPDRYKLRAAMVSDAYKKKIFK